MFDPSKLMGMMKQAAEMQGKMQEQLKLKTVVGASGGDMVKVIMNGQFDVIDLKLDEKLLAMNDVAFIEDLVRAGVNDAIRQARELVASEMNSMIPGLTPSLN